MAEEKQRHGGGGGGEIVKVEPKPNKGLSSKVIDFVEKVMVKFMDQNNNHSSQSHHYLSGTFTPVSEETPPTTDLLVKGHLPECLNGEFVRVGPNPKFTPVAGYHWFDGDGCVIFCNLILPVFLSSFLEERILTYNFSII
ncbi:carotenoid 9,10(9',10')-cleavage dioxygenase 1-like [Quercus suber]|uniref:carotenoid 9,10(9',10')-cleavage dioxygenase 1-like n=1 Tax=Quercus suber TaxID=58331 RepID=UPI0032E006AA